MRVEIKSTLAALLIAASAFWAGGLFGQDRPLDLVASVDLNRYQGLWYEIGRLPNRFQDQCAGNVTAEYTLLDDGLVRAVNRCERADGRAVCARGMARRPDPEREGALEVRFVPRWLSWLPFVWGDYQLMALGDDYDDVMVGAPSRKYLWVLARDPLLPQRRLEQLLDEAERQGFDTRQFTRTRQDI